jgi:predicted nuclease of predicted toxin-antitoxin system
LRFVIDQQLPDALADVLRQLGHEAIHVKSLGMTDASDLAISTKAIELGATILTKDSDFVRLAPIGPKVVWIRLGNCPNSVLYRRISETLELVIDELTNAQVAEIVSASPDR